MTSRLHFEMFMQKLRVRASEAGPKQLVLSGLRPDGNEDVGLVRLSQLEAAIKETRAGRSDE